MNARGKTRRLAAVAGLAAAAGSSLCCIGPLVAALAGITGSAASFSWLEPLRPYLMGLSVLALGFSFYMAYKPKPRSGDCCVPTIERRRFWMSRTFPWVMTGISILLVAFPYYQGLFHHRATPPTDNGHSPSLSQKVAIRVSGMTCSACEYHIEDELGRTRGVLESDADFGLGLVVVDFDPVQARLIDIRAAVVRTGYTITSLEEVGGTEPGRENED